jgi:hypothetical protein
MEISAMQVVAPDPSVVSTSFFYSSAQLCKVYKDRTVAAILDYFSTAVISFSPSKMRLIHRFVLLSTLLCGLAHAKQDPRLETAIVTETPINGVSTTPEGRTFLLYARVDGSTGPTVVESVGNKTIPFPNLGWNSYNASKDPSTHFVRINSQRIGPDGQLWIVDVGSPAFGEPVILPEGPKLVALNLTTNEVSRVYLMGNVTLAQSLLDDIRFNPKSGKAYLTDAGVPALIVLDIASGEARRVLENDVSTRGNMPVSAEGRLVRGAGGAFLYAYADQLEVSPDAMWLYYQSCDGGMYWIETKYLDQAFYNSSIAIVLAQYPEPFAPTPATGEFFEQHSTPSDFNRQY